ncbi:alpha-hydroxy acid oxidase [Streptomyces sp. NPDC048258]|uniref:alpha-hydroxy acid oxidase n=1 Tax=Streptomyces sp. NPDC048258 TaxID=3365527 RepID=UPI0037115AC9
MINRTTLSVPELEEAARDRLDSAAYDFYSAGSGEEISRDEAHRAWQEYRLKPRILRDVSEPDTSVGIFGTELASPVIAAPTAFHSMADPEGEVATARGVAGAGSLLVLSSRATREVEDVAAAAGPWWFQVYALRDRELTREQVERAAAAGARALVLTVDAPYVAAKPRVRRPLPLSAQDRLSRDVGLDTRSSAWEQDPSIGPETIARLARESGLPVLVKGVLRPDDATACVEAGASGVIVSNHGGRQLDRSVSTAAALPEVVRAVGDRVPVLVDGGIHTGTDVLTALALGARAVLVGRPVLWALATGGSEGVRSMFESYRAGFAESMALAGAGSVRAITPDLVAPPYRAG